MADLELPLMQSDAFQRTCEQLGLAVTRVDVPGGTCLVQSRRLPLIGSFHLASRGPVVEDNRSLPNAIHAIRSKFRGPMVINAPAHSGPTGGVKIAPGAELAMIDLKSPSLMRSRLDQKWRNQLNKAERSDLQIHHRPLDATRDKWFLQAEAAQQKSRGYKSFPTEFLLAFAAINPQQARVFTATINDQPVAAMLVLQHGAMATYQAGVTTELGRRTCAHNLLLWAIMNDLYEQGTQRLDLGRADLSPGLRRFKLGSGAVIERLAGSFFSHHFLVRKAHSKKQDSNRPELRAGT